MSSYSLVYQCDGCRQIIKPDSHKEKIRSMPCFHTLCNACIMDACKGRVQSCPKCHKEWDLGEMRRFTCCSVCKYFRKQAVSHCVDCNKDMCLDCEKRHLNNSVWRDHQVLAIPQQFGMEISSKIREAGLEREEDPNKKADLCSHKRVERKKKQKDPFYMLEEDTDSNLPGVTCTSKLQLDTSDFSALMKDKQSMVDVMVQDTEAQLSFFADVLDDNPDLKENMEANMDVFVQESIDQVQDIMSNSHWDSNLTYEISVTGKALEAEAKPEILVKTKTVPHLNFKDIPKHKFELKNSVPINGNARRVYRVNNRVMVNTWESSLIYNFDFKLLDETRWGEKCDKYETSAGVPINESIIVIADFEKGLFMINQDGSIREELCGGCFCDVDVYDDKAYALEYDKRLVKVFRFLALPRTFHNIENVALTYDNVSSGDTVRAFQGRLYISSSQNHCVFIYDLNIDKFRQVGKYGKASLLPSMNFDLEGGLLFYPRIAMADHYGNALVADSWNKRLLVLHDDDTWAKIDLGGEEGEIWDVYLEQAMENIWAISFVNGEYRLLRFVQR